jgi:tagaturonate reductase
MELNRKTATTTSSYPTRILQFGEGNFLRAFADWIVNKMNKEIGFNAGVDVVQPLANGMVDMLNKQDGLYHVYLKGIKNGEPIKESPDRLYPTRVLIRTPSLINMSNRF